MISGSQLVSQSDEEREGVWSKSGNRLCIVRLGGSACCLYLVQAVLSTTKEEMKSKTSRRPSFLAKPGGRGMRRKEVPLLPPKRSLAFEHRGVPEVGTRSSAEEKRIEVDWRRDKSKSLKLWEGGEEGCRSGVNKYEARGDQVIGKVGEEKRKASDERRKTGDERKTSDEKRKLSDERRKVSDEKRKLSNERRRQVSEKAKEEGREKLSQFIRKEIVYPHLLQVRFYIPISCSFSAIF